MANNLTSTGIGAFALGVNPPAQDYLNNQKGLIVQTKADDGKTQNPILKTVEVTLARKLMWSNYSYAFPLESVQ